MASSDFITGQPTSKTGNDAMTTFVDHLSRPVHFVTCNTSDSAQTVAANVFKLVFTQNGLPDAFISNKDV